MEAAPNGCKGVRQARGKTAKNRTAASIIIMMLPVSVKDLCWEVLFIAIDSH